AAPGPPSFAGPPQDAMYAKGATRRAAVTPARRRPVETGLVDCILRGYHENRSDPRGYDVASPPHEHERTGAHHRHHLENRSEAGRLRGRRSNARHHRVDENGDARRIAGSREGRV